MKCWDFYLRPVEPGAQVVFMLNTGGRRCRRELTRGTVLRITPAGYPVIQHASRWHTDKTMETICKLDLILVPEELRK